jgi:hypothetical protein
VRGPLNALWNSPIVGTYLRFRVAMFLAGLLAVVGAVVLLGIGGIPGLIALFALVVALFVVLGGLLLSR